eukprot:scaffold27658_cov18-Tisochrysis_lutea.AAC.2
MELANLARKERKRTAAPAQKCWASCLPHLPAFSLPMGRDASHSQQDSVMVEESVELSKRILDSGAQLLILSHSIYCYCAVAYASFAAAAVTSEQASQEETLATAGVRNLLVYIILQCFVLFAHCSLNPQQAMALKGGSSCAGCHLHA